MTTFDIPCFSKIKVLPAAVTVNVTKAILNLLAEQPRKSIDLADALGIHSHAITNRLKRLEANRRVHSVRVNTRRGVHYVWHIGPANGAVYALPLEAEPVDEIQEEDPSAGQPTRKFVSVYTIDTPRDPLIAALFGQARKEVA